MASGKKRRPGSEAEVEEAEKTMHAAFRGAANALSQVYAHSMSHQKLAFHAGETHALEEVYEWMLSKQEEGSRLAVADVVAHLQNEIDHVGEEVMPVPPLCQVAQHHPHCESNVPGANILNNHVPFVPAAPMPNHRIDHTDQTRSTVFSNSLSSPLEQNLMQNPLAQCQGPIPSSGSGNGTRNNYHSQVQDFGNMGFTDSSMDMQSDMP